MPSSGPELILGSGQPLAGPDGPVSRVPAGGRLLAPLWTSRLWTSRLGESAAAGICLAAQHTEIESVQPKGGGSLRAEPSHFGLGIGQEGRLIGLASRHGLYPMFPISQVFRMGFCLGG